MEVMEGRAPLVVLPNPLTLEGQNVSRAEFLAGETLGAYLERVGICVGDGPVNVWHNDRAVPNHLWRRLIPRPGDRILIRTKVEGGGGGGKVLRAVALVALVIVSAGYGAALGGALGFTGATAAAVGSSLIMLGGTLLVNTLLPMPMPTAAKLGSGEKYESSPTYSIQGGRNRARPWEPMLLVFGRHKVVPDLAGKPFNLQNGDDQYLYQGFHFGLQGSALSLTDIKIGNTAIENYQGVQMERSGPNGQLRILSGNVDTIQGFAISSSDGWQTRTTPADTFTIYVDFAARLFVVNDDGAIGAQSVDVRLQYKKKTDSTWIELGGIGAVYASHYWSLQDANTGQQVEFGSTNAADHIDGDRQAYDLRLSQDSDGALGVGVWRWAVHPHSRGLPWAGIAPDPVITPASPGIRITGARQNPTRLTISWTVAPGQYDIRVQKVSADVNESRRSNETAVSQILAVQTDNADYTGQARLGVSIKASGQLNGAIDELSAIASFACPVWNGSGWVTAQTSNPAWSFLWFARGSRDNGGNLRYGCGLADDQIDIDGIKAWATWCDRNKLSFNYVLDRKASGADVLNIIARAGRAAMTYQSGKLGVVWNAPNQPEVAAFGPFNIKAGSFQVAYTNEGAVDEVVLNFVNEDRDWTMDEVRVTVPGVSTTKNPMQLDFDGCTNVDMAGREANLIAASQVWHRRRCTFETDVEGYVVTRGDVIRITHDLTMWGYSGRMQPGSHSGTSSSLPVIVLDASVPSGGSGTAIIRDPSGRMKVVAVESEPGNVSELTIITDLDGFAMPGDSPYEDASPLDWVWQFGPLETPGRRFKVTSVEPSIDGVKFSAIDDDEGYYQSENDPYQYTPPRDGALLVGVVFAISATESIVSVTADQIRVLLSWTLSRDMPVIANVSVNGIARASQTIDGRNIDVLVQTGDVITATITPSGSTGLGTPKTITYQVQWLGAPLPPVEGLTTIFRDGLTVLTWRRVIDVREPSYEVKLGDVWSNARSVGVTDALEMLAVGNGSYWVAARFRLANGTVIYGPAAGINVSGAVLVRNVLIAQDEAPEWDGTVSGGAVVYEGMLTLAAQGDWLDSPDLLGESDLLWLGGAATEGMYTNAVSDQVDIGYVSPVRLSFDVEFLAISQDDDLYSMPDVLAAEDWLNGSARRSITARPQIRHAQVFGEWTDWVDFVPGIINARYFDVRLYLATDNPRVIPFVTKFEWVVDVPDLVQHAESVTVPIGGMRVTFPKQFHARPNLQITILDTQNADRAVVPDATADMAGFDISILNGSTPVERQINWIAQGY